jgi:hypothetical protein
MPVLFAASDYLPMAEHSYMWILTIRFDIAGEEGGDEVINAIITSPQYGYDFASPFDGTAGPSHPDIHGRWWRRHIGSDRFELCSPAHAVEVVRSWAEDQKWTDPNFTQPLDAQQRLNDTYSVLQAGEVYELNNPLAEHEHDYGWVMGRTGFHEFLVIDRTHRTATLVVTCDD